MVFKNVDMTGGKIRLTRPVNVLDVVLITVICGVVAVLLASDLQFGSESFWLELGILVFVFLVWLFFIARQKSVTTFDPETRLIARRNLLWPRASIPFDQVGVVAFIHQEATSRWNGEMLRLTPRGNRFGKGITLTKVYAGADPELVYIRAVVLPALEAMLGADQAAPGAPAGDRVRSLPESPRFFTKRGGVYRRLTLSALYIPLLITIIFLAWAAVDWHAVNAGIGALFLVVSLLIPFKVELDSDLREVRQYKFLGLRVNRRISFDKFRNVLTVREHQNGIYSGTRMELCFDGVEWTIPLARVFFTGKLEHLLEETEDIILAANR